MASEIVIHPDDIIREGWLVKESKHMKTWRRRWVVLTPQYLCSFKTQGQARNPTEWVRTRECSGVRSADQETGKENSFCIKTPTRTLLLIAESTEDMENWVGQVGRQMVRRTVMLKDEDFE